MKTHLVQYRYHALSGRTGCISIINFGEVPWEVTKGKYTQEKSSVTARMFDMIEAYIIAIKNAAEKLGFNAEIEKHRCFRAPQTL